MGNRLTERAREYRALSRYGKALLLIALIAAAQPTAARTLCPIDHPDQQVKVDHVYDGDTLTLRDGRRVRLIGMDTPELGRDGAPDQPYAAAARDALRGLLKKGTALNLRFDATRHDKYGRLLAHAFLVDGTSLSAWMLERGYATLLIVPPDTWNAACYETEERQARSAHRGIWSLPRYQPIAGSRLAKTARGYRVIQGRVAHVGESAHSIWLDLEGDVGVRIDKQDLHYFAAVPLRKLKHATVRVRGWVYAYKQSLNVRLRYPTNLEVVE